MKHSTIRVGVIDVGRGQSFVKGAGEAKGMKVGALCDTWEARLQQVCEEYDVATYTVYTGDRNRLPTGSRWYRLYGMKWDIKMSEGR